MGDETTTAAAGERPTGRFAARDPVGLDAVFSQSRVGIAVFDDRLRFVQVNQMMAELNHRPVEAHIGRTMSEMFGEPGRTVERVLHEALEGGHALVDVEVSGDHPDMPGAPRHFQATYTPIRGRDGRVQGVSAVVLEVTQRQRTQTERERLLDAQREATARADGRRAAAERASARSRLLAEIGTALEATRGIRARTQRLLDLLIPRFADFATVELASADGRSELAAVAHVRPEKLPVLRALREHHALGRDAPHGVARLLDDGRPQLIERISPPLAEEYAADDETLALLLALDPRSYIGVALTSRGRIIGALILTRAGARRPFEREDLVFAQDLAGRTALPIDNERLYEREHETALELQRSMLAGELPRGECIEIAVAYHPTPGELELAGGDWHDAVTRPDGRVALIVGDVVGHGLPAATAMGRLRSACRALALIRDDPAELLHDLDAFAERTPGAAHATVVCVLLHAESGELRYACAGHPPPLITAAGAAPRYLTCGRSVPLATTPSQTRASATATLAPGETLLLYSDGLIERRGESLDAGLSRLGDALGPLGEDDLAALVKGLVPAMLTDARQRDDIALLAARRHEPRAEATGSDDPAR